MMDLMLNALHTLILPKRIRAHISTDCQETMGLLTLVCAQILTYN